MRAKKQRIEKAISDKLKQRGRYLDMYAKELIAMVELEGYVQAIKVEIESLSAEIKIIADTVVQAEN